MGTLLLSLLTSALFSGQETLTAGHRGLPVSSVTPSFMPTHVTGPNAGGKSCPVCVYGLVPQLQIWSEEAHLGEAIALGRRIDVALARQRQADIAYLVVAATKESELSSDSKRRIDAAGFKHVFVTSIPSWDDPLTGGLYGHAMRDRPGVRAYAVINRRTFKRWDRPTDVAEMMAALNEGRRYVTTHAIADPTIAPAWVKGQRMQVDFRLVDAAGKPMSGIKVSAIQTDTTGLYNPQGWGRMEPTLSALAWTNDQGRIVFRTIYPGPYPTKTEPSHIHFTATISGKPQWRTLWFEGDPIITTEKRRWADQDEETVIVPIARSGDVWRVTHTFKAR